MLDLNLPVPSQHLFDGTRSHCKCVRCLRIRREVVETQIDSRSRCPTDTVFLLYSHQNSFRDVDSEFVLLSLLIN